MSHFRPDILAMQGYVPGEQPQDEGWVKLNTNENPYPPSPAALAAARATLAKAQLYSDPLSTGLRQAAAQRYGLTAAQVIAGNGSDDVLNLLVRATAASEQVVASFTPSYTLYRTLAEVQGAAYREIPFAEGYAVPEDLDLAGVRLLFLPNPNAPSGTMVSHETIARLCAVCPGLVVIDEAYADFARENAIGLLAAHDNLVITRTFSKSYALAGLRIGLALAAAPIIEQLMKVKDSYNLDRVAQAAGTAALGDADWLARTVTRLCATRDRLAAALGELGLFVYPSEANFLLVRFDRPDAAAVFAALKERRILVRYFNTPQLKDCLRITVGTDAQANRLLAALAEILPSPH